jgi:hypothetical protein
LRGHRDGINEPISAILSDDCNFLVGHGVFLKLAFTSLLL